MSARAIGSALMLMVSFGVSASLPANAAAAPASSAVMSAEQAAAPQATASEVTKIHAHGFRFGHWNNHFYGFGPYYHPYRPYYYRPYNFYQPACGWRKRCWWDGWGRRHCRWVNTCRRYY
jgi:hypothetical protein